MPNNEIQYSGTLGGVGQMDGISIRNWINWRITLIGIQYKLSSTKKSGSGTTMMDQILQKAVKVTFDERQ